jgi:hypothetical protein
VRLRNYQAMAGFLIVSVRVQCVHCDQEMDSSEASRHKQEHAIYRAAEKNRIPRRRFPR